MMQCPSCAALLTSGEARCGTCRALVNPPVHGASALAPRLVTPQSVQGPGDPSDPPPPEPSEEPKPTVTPSSVASQNPADEAWRREVLERVRKRRQARRTHVLPLFSEGQTPAGERTQAEAAATPELTESKEQPLHDQSSPHRPLSLHQEGDEDEVEGGGPESDRIRDVATRPAPPAPDHLASIDAPLSADDDEVFDLPLRPAESESMGRTSPAPSIQNLVERPRPASIGQSGSRSLVGDLPLVEPTRTDPPAHESPRRTPSSKVSSRAASFSDRIQAAFIDFGMWSAMSVTAFYFASRIARTSIAGLGPAWQGLALFGFVLAAAYILFFGGLSGATPGKLACGIHVKRYDGSSLGPLASLGRGLLGILGVVFLGVGVWPAFWDKDRRTLHDRATDSRVTIV